MGNPSLKAALQGCSEKALLALVIHLLSRSGFREVQILNHRSATPLDHSGSYVICVSTLNHNPETEVIKVVPGRITAQHLDELAIAIIRLGAHSGIVMSAHNLNQKAKAILDRYRAIRLSVIEGSLLTSYCEILGLGLRNESEVDYEYFGELETIAERLLSHLPS